MNDKAEGSVGKAGKQRVAVCVTCSRDRTLRQVKARKNPEPMSSCGEGATSVPCQLVKVLLVGDAGVGKSSLLLRFTDGSFDERIQSTIGVDFKVKYMEENGKRLKVTLWDTAGQERFRTLTGAYYRGCDAVVLVYDVNRRESMDNLKVWMEEGERASSH